MESILCMTTSNLNNYSWIYDKKAIDTRTTTVFRINCNSEIWISNNRAWRCVMTCTYPSGYSWGMEALGFSVMENWENPWIRTMWLPTSSGGGSSTIPQSVLYDGTHNNVWCPTYLWHYHLCDVLLVALLPWWCPTYFGAPWTSTLASWPTLA